MSARFRVLAVEDEGPAQETLRQLVEADTEAEWLGACWGEAAIGRIREAEPDILLLDVKMPNTDGLEVLRRARREGGPDPVVIFVTAHGEHAVEAFEVRANDYLLKPFTDERFYRALNRAKAQVGRHQMGRLPSHLDREDVGVTGAVAAVRPDRIILEDAGTTFVLPPAEVRWIEASGPYVVIHTDNGEHLVRASLTGMAEALAPAGFVRVHRSAVVNLGAVRTIRSLTHGDGLATLDDGTRLRVSRTYRAGLDAALRG